MLDVKTFEYLKVLNEWKDLGKSMGKIYSGLSEEDLEYVTLEDVKELIYEDCDGKLTEKIKNLGARLIYEKLQADLDKLYPNPVEEIKRLIH